MISLKKKNKSPLKNSRLAIRKRRIFYAKIFGIAAAIIIFIAGASLISKLNALAIKVIAVEGNAAVDVDGLKAIAQENLAGSYAYLFSKSNKLLYDKDSIKAQILENNTRVESVEVSTKRDTLTISIKERAPAYTWCTGMPQDTGSKVCYFLDSNGYIFAESPIFSGNVFFAFYGLIPADKAIGATFLDSQEFKDIDKLITFLNSHSAKPYALVAKDNGIFEIYFEESGKLLFKQDQSVDLLIANLDVIVKNTPIFTTLSSKLEYIDMRFGNKVYYKISGDNEVQEVEESGV
ncbi:MAG: hypothetical protein V4519_03980 [Patescibacteria group bacterium]